MVSGSAKRPGEQHHRHHGEVLIRGKIKAARTTHTVMKFRSQFALALAIGVSVFGIARAQHFRATRLPTNADQVAPGGSGDRQTARLQTVDGQTRDLQIDASPPAGYHQRIIRYTTEGDGDHSLDAATVAEQAFGRYALYVVRLQFASGHEESIAVTAPPGGLQPEMRDMSGDHVANDVVLTSKVLRSPLVVLLNDGHDHLTVEVSPGSFATDGNRASGGHPAHHVLALASLRFRLARLANEGAVVFPELSERMPFPIATLPNDHAMLASNAERAPPAFSIQNLNAN
jgi:hypothetical protein